MKKALLLAVALVFLIAVFSIAAYAASGPSVRTAKAAEKEPLQSPGKISAEEAAQFKCSSLETMKERIRCRLKLEEENEYEYLPEECRAQINTSRQKCVSNYKKVQKCWEFGSDAEKVSCAKTNYGLTGTVAEQKAACDSLTGTNKSQCILELRDRVDAVVKFRIYNLEEKAQHLMEKGADEELVTGFVTLMEEKKQAYNAAETVNQKKLVVIEVRNAWKGFVTTAKGQVIGNE